MRPTELIDPNANVATFFREAVEAAIESRGYETSEASETYVVALLADYARPNALGDRLTRPFTLMLDEALRSAGPERFERLRTLGDAVLYVSGFFGEHLSNRGVPLRYVSDVGSTAYDRAAAMLRRTGRAPGAPDLFEELATNFKMFVGLLNEVADGVYASAARDDRRMLGVYERWLESGSGALASALSAWGLIPKRGDGALH